MKYVNKKRIPKSNGNVLGGILMLNLTEYFEDPKHQKEFEEWKKNRKKK